MKNQNLTDFENRLYHSPEDKENFFWLDMVIKIRTLEKCVKCGNRFVMTGRGLVCPTHPRSKPNNYFLDWFYNSERFKLYGFDSFKTATKKASSIDEEITEHKFKPENYKGQKAKINKKFSFDIRYDSWLKIKKLSVKPAYYRKLRQYNKEFVSFFGCEDIRTIGNDRISSYHESLLGKVSSKTQYNKLGILRAFFQSLFDREAIHTMPKFPKIKFIKNDPVWITEEQQTEILKVIPKQHHAIFKFLFWSGCRHGEARALHWKDIDYEKGIITIKHNFSDKMLTTPKDGEERKIPLTEPLKKLLQKQLRDLRSPFVFNLDGKYYYEGCIGKVWRKACKKIGLAGVRSYDASRHSFASQMVNRGKSLFIVGQILGHSNTQTTQKYAHVSIDAMREAMEK